MKKLILAITIVLSLAFVNTATAQQKFGHVNTQELFNKMPQVAALETQLQNKSKEYQAQLETLYAQYQKIAGDIQTNGASYSEMVLEQKYKEGAALEQKITNIENAAQQELANYKETQLKPIEDKAFDAIQKVAKANGYTYIFDGSLGILIVKPDSDDITNMVKAELGI